MESLPIVEKLYVFCDLSDGFLPCLEMALKNKFSLQGSPEAFHWGVVIAIPLTAHGCPHSEPVNQPTGILGTILASTIRVVDQPGCRAFHCHSMEQRLVDQVFRHPGAHGIADYLSGVHVLVSGKIERALIRRDIRNVSQPDLARRRSLESLFKQVLRQRQTMTGVRRRFKPAFLFTLQAKLLSKTPDAMNSDRYPWSARSRCNRSGPYVSRVHRCAARISTSSRASS